MNYLKITSTTLLFFIFSSVAFSQAILKDTVQLPTIIIKDSLLEAYKKIDISDSIDAWQELILIQEVINETDDPLIITRVSTGSGGMVPQTSASQLKPCLPGEKSILYYKYLRAGNVIHKSINFDYTYVDQHKEFKQNKVIRSIVKLEKHD